MIYKETNAINMFVRLQSQTLTIIVTACFHKELSKGYVLQRSLSVNKQEMSISVYFNPVNAVL